MNSGTWINWLVCFFVGCRLDRIWDTYQTGPDQFFTLKQCSRCGFPEHHGRVRRGWRGGGGRGNVKTQG